MRMVAAGAALLIAFIWVWNTSFLTTVPEDASTNLLSHRGVHQTFSTEGLQNDTCTAERILPPTHDFIENTIPSMRAAFEEGANVVEVDVHLTPDDQLAVFHDWTLDCRTEGQGVTEETRMSALKALDVGYGYTADGGSTYPLRGKGVGLMPTLSEVLDEFPDRKFLINFKSERKQEAEAFAALLDENPTWRKAIFGVYGGRIPTKESLRLLPGLRGYDKTSSVSCLIRYLAIGWTGVVPAPCRNTLVIIPGNYAWMMWGWPYRFAQRMRNAGSEIVLLGPYHGGGFTSGIDEGHHMSLIPKDFDGYVWTNRIEVIGPLLNDRDE